MNGEPLEAQLAPGTMVGGYCVEHRLGGGGVGTVYAAEEPTIKKRVAIKVLRRVFVDDPASAARFEREARAANAIRHPGILDVLGLGHLEDGRPYLVMNLLEGRSLRDELSARVRLPADEAWSLAREIAEALGAAHAGGVVHRDLKPDNVFLERFGARAPRPRVLDFGIAKVTSTDDGEALAKLTQTGVPIGTPAYMAPEQWWCHPVTPATDQYCFGVLLFEMLTGRLPFASSSFVELLQKHLHEQPPTLAEAGADVGPAVEALVARALGKAPEDRFASMSDLVAAGDEAFGAPVGSSEPGAELAPRGSPRSATDGPADGEIATTVAAPSAKSTTLPTAAGAAAAPLARFFAIHVAVVVAAVLGVIGMGYAGEAKRDPVEWFRLGGFAQFGTLASGVLCAVLLGVFARRRARSGNVHRGAFLVAMLPGIGGTFGTYTGWRMVLTVVPTRSINSLSILNEGMYEANADRFLGFSISMALCVSLAALPGVSGLANPTRTLVTALGIGRREALLAAAGLGALAVAALVLGAPAATLVASVAAAVALVSVLLPTLHADTAARDEIERALAGLLAVGLATAVAFTRIEAREAVLWHEQPTRAARVAEILAAQSERDATTAFAIASLAVVGLLEALRLSRIWQRRGALRPTLGTALLGLLVAAAVTLDVTVHGRFIGTRDELRAAIAGEFAVFARLDPPRADALDLASYPTHRATALQVTRDAVAIDAKGVAKLAALESAEGRARVSQDLARALAQAAVDRPATDDGSWDAKQDVDLSLCVDADVPLGTVETLLRIARGAGARHVDLLLSRGPTPMIPLRAPPETQIVIPRDFVALPILLGDDGLTLDARAGAKYADVVTALVHDASPGKPVHVNVPREAAARAPAPGAP
ncbi:MAG TPA: serine/threonine-protein kinase [Byssovorax sp.]|jgi:tRNA A-37 threonylcarbamoyl transferase component Bud32